MDLEEIDHKLEHARKEKEEAERNEARWEEKIQECKTRIWEGEQELRGIQDHLEQKQQELEEQKEEILEQQEILQWEHHEKSFRIIEEENLEKTEEIIRDLDMLKKLIEECRREKAEIELVLENAQKQVLASIDQWIVEIFELKKNSSEWKPEEELLRKLQERIRVYHSVEDAGFYRKCCGWIMSSRDKRFWSRKRRKKMRRNP